MKYLTGLFCMLSLWTDQVPRCHTCNSLKYRSFYVGEILDNLKYYFKSFALEDKM